MPEQAEQKPYPEGREVREQTDLPNRTYLEGLLFVGSSASPRPNEPYDRGKILEQIRKGIIPMELLKTPSDPSTQPQVEEINEDRKKGLRGMVFVFENLYVEMSLPSLNPQGRISPDSKWGIRAGKDGEEQPILYEEYRDILKISPTDGQWELTFKRP